MRNRPVAALLGLLLILTLSVAGAGIVAAQEGPTSTGVPTGDIVPRPNSGEAPQDAGDRGGALQLLLPALLVLAVGGGAWHLSRQARAGRAEQSPS